MNKTLNIKNNIVGKINTFNPVYISFDERIGTTQNYLPFFLRQLLSSYFLNINIPETIFPCPESQDKKCKPNVGYVFDPRIDNLMTTETPSRKIYDKADNKFGFTPFFLEQKIFNDLPLYFIKSLNSSDYVFFPTNDIGDTIGGGIPEKRFAMAFIIDGNPQENIYSGYPYKVEFYFINDDKSTRKININIPSLIPSEMTNNFEGIQSQCKNNFFYVTPSNIKYHSQNDIYFTIYQKNYYYFSNTMTCELTNDYAVPMLQGDKNNNQVFYTSKNLCELACGNKIKLCYLIDTGDDKITSKNCGTDGCYGPCENVNEMCVLDKGQFKCIKKQTNNKTGFYIFGTFGFVILMFILFFIICIFVKK